MLKTASELTEPSVKAQEYAYLYDEYVTRNAARPDVVVNFPLNEGKPDPLPAITINPDVDTIYSNCDQSINCLLWNEVDWDYKYQVEARCTDMASGDDPCFATQACVCSNDYIRISASMPSLIDDIEIPDTPEQIKREDVRSMSGSAGL